MKAEPGSSLIARQEELALLERRIAVWDQGPALVDIAGEPGRGKTRLLDEFAERATAAGAMVVTVVPADLEGGLPDRLADLDERTGVVLLVDDVHELGPSATDALITLLHRPPRAALLLVLAYRPRQCAPRLLSALSTVRRSWHADHLGLGDLDRAGSEQLAGSELCFRHRGAIHESSGGNPRYLRLLAASCGGQESCQGGAFLHGPMPAREAAPLFAELAAHTGDTQLVAHAAAVLGEPVEPDLLAEVAQVDKARVLAAMDELLAADLLRPSAVPGHVEYRHPVVCQVAYAAAPGGWRLGAHHRAAEAFRRGGHPVVRCARHLEQTSVSGDESSVALLAAAAEAMTPSSPAMAASWFRAAERLLPGTLSCRQRRQALLAGVARASTMAGRPADARAALEQRDQLLDGQDPFPESADVAAQRAALARFDGLGELARDIIRTALTAQAESGLPDQRAELCISLAGTALEETTQVASDWADDAVLAAAGSADELLRAHALAVHGTVRLGRGAVAVARGDVLSAARLADKQTDRNLAHRLCVLSCLGQLETQLEQYGPALRHFTRGLSLSHSTGQWPAAASMAIGLGTVFLRQGRLVEAAAQAEEAAVFAEFVGSTELRAMALCLHAQVALETQDMTSALTAARAACSMAGEDGPRWLRARMILAAAELGSGDAIGCLVTLAGAGLSDPGSSGLPLSDQVALAETLCGAELALGHLKSARLLAGRARSAAAGLDLAGWRAVAGLMSVAVCESPADLLSLANDALTTATVCGHLVDAGWARVAAARALTQLAEPERAARHLEVAADTAVSCGAVRLTAEVARTRQTLERPVIAEPFQGSYMLSQREFEISTLVSRGCTNRQIARTLGVSHKTVETHLGRIFAKLEVSSRAEIANMMGRNTVFARPRTRSKVLAGVS